RELAAVRGSPPIAADKAAWGPAISQLTREQTTVTDAWPSTTIRASRRARAKSIATKLNPVEQSSRINRLLCQKWPAHYRDAALEHQGVCGLFCAYWMWARMPSNSSKLL